MDEASEGLAKLDDTEFLKNLGESLLEGMTDWEIAQFLFGKINPSEL